MSSKKLADLLGLSTSNKALPKLEGPVPEEILSAVEIVDDTLAVKRADSLRSIQKEEEKKHIAQWDQLTIDEILVKINTDAKAGLSSGEAHRRLLEHGRNELDHEARPSFLVLFLMQIVNLIIILLIASAAASLIVSGIGPDKKQFDSYLDGIAIVIIVLLNAGIGAYTENSAAGALEALSKLSQPRSKVIRDGDQIWTESTELTIGDIVLLTVGDIVPADVRLIEADDLKVNEMLLTGEPEDVTKYARMKQKDGPEHLTAENMAFSSCTVANGKAKAVVVAIGMNTKVGGIATLIKNGGDAEKKVEEKKGCLPDGGGEQTPLQESLENLGVKLGIFAIVACVVIFILGVSIGSYDINNPTADEPVDVIIYMVLISVTLAVAAIPEGIPLCVTIALSTGCSDMVKEHVLVRKLAAVETLGCASVICTDKTGTLTEGKMTMVKLWSGGVDYDISGKGFDPTVGKIVNKATQEDSNAKPGVLSTLASGLLCCNTFVKKETDPDDGTVKWVPHGNSSEAPIVVAAAKVGLSIDEINASIPRVFEIPFSSSRKMMLTVADVSDVKKSLALVPILSNFGDSKFLANVKGAPNFILEKCSHWIDADGGLAKLTAGDKDRILATVDQLSGQALRVLAIACRPFPELPFDPETADDISSDQKFAAFAVDLTLVGLVASIDPERDGVPQAVLQAQKGHIRVIMITGDYLTTAQAIGQNVNILQENDDISIASLDCGKLRPDEKYLSEAEIDEITKTVKCYARAQPEDKLQIVKSLQRQGLVCAMTGDGVNDAPALSSADIGVAMGLNGTEVAKGASAMVLTDDNFCSIVKAVEKGRVIYAGIQKFVAFILSIHIGEVIAIFFCIVVDLPIMRTPLQILFLNLLTELPPSIALGMERSSSDVLTLPPRPKTQPLLSKKQWVGVIVISFVLAAATLGVFSWGLSFYLDNVFFVDDLAELFCNGTCDSEAAKDGNLNEEAIKNLRLARTVAFITVVFVNDMRAYGSRSFTEPIWTDFIEAKAMHVAISISLLVLVIALFVPGFSDEVLELEGVDIGWEGWIAAIIASLCALLATELYKVLEKSIFPDPRLLESDSEKLIKKDGVVVALPAL